ncbi:aerolysin-like protein [Tachysurus vachellii]|uniref:aerolysin-like protein n=1 Tax=Tachysurus vachellii TaxID=175792 RepID=UPI00296AA215|nr:aerolysin-like protein [Tachysurus vachellii]
MADYEVGGQGGNAFNFNGNDTGSMLKKIQVWEDDNTLRAVKVWLTDGRSEQFGRPAGNIKEFTFENGEYFTSLSLWPNQDGTRLGAIKFKTSQSREFFAILKNGRLNPEVSVDVAFGICIGIKGRSGRDIDRFGFIFIRSVKSAQLTDVVYPTIHDVIPKVADREIESMSYYNSTSENQEYKIEKTDKITKKSSWSVKGNMEYVYGLEVNAGIPQLVDLKSSFKLTIGVESTYASETSEEKREHFTFPVKVPAGKTVDVHITLGQAATDLPFTGIMKITCHNGRVLELKTSGTYKGVAYTDGKVVVNESNKMLGAA